MNRDSMVFYRSFFEAIEALPPEEQVKAFRAIIDYGLNGTEPEENGIAKALYLMAKPQIDANNSRYTNGKKGGRPKTEAEEQTENQTVTEANQTITENNQTITKKNQTITKANQTVTKTKKAKPNVNVNDNVNDNKKEKYIKEKGSAFVPPTAGEVESYCKETGYALDAEVFVDFYQSKNWMVGKNKMKDWRAAVRNWCRNRRQGATAEGGQRLGMTAKVSQFNNFHQRDYDYNEYERQLLSRNIEPAETAGDVCFG